MNIDIHDSAAVRIALIKSGITPTDGIAYILYECGHSFSTKDDPTRMLWYASVGKTVRSCPKCKRKKILVKYKRCKCGVEQVGPKVQTSKYCNACSYVKQQQLSKRSRSRRNKQLADGSRIYCVNRSDCLLKYIKCDTIPCRGCANYSIEEKFA